MYDTLLLEAGGGIIANHQVSPQQGDASVMIGIGGTGIAALRKIKKAVYQHLEPDSYTEDSLPQYDRIRFLAIDTDQHDLENNPSDESMLSPNEQFSILDVSLSHRLAHQRRNLEWMSMDHIQMDGFHDTGAIRQVGRYCLFQKIVDLRSKITNLIMQARDAAQQRDVNVHIFAGISGGTGSGCFIDVCYIVRDILETIPGQIYGYFFLPDVQLCREGIMGQEAIKKWNKQNGYAALRELDYLMNLSSSNEWFEQDYGTFSIKTQQRPVDLCYLISGTNSEGRIMPNAYDYCLDVVAEYVLSFLSKIDASVYELEWNDSGLTLRGLLTNVTMGGMISTQYGAERNYHILGASSAELPLTHIGTYLAGKTYEKLQPSLGRHSSNEILSRVAGGLGYTFDGMRGLIIDRVNFKPTYNMGAIDLPDRLNENEMDWNIAIPAITQPITVCHDTATNIMTANYNAQTKELQNYDFAKTEKVENPTFAANLFNSLIRCAMSVNDGPTMAAELLHSDTSKDLTNVMDGIIAQANQRQESHIANETLRIQDICTAAKNYNRTRFSRSKKQKLVEYLEARDNYLKLQLEVEVCRRVVRMCSEFKQIISNLYANYFSPLRNMLRELHATFQANINWLDVPENLRTQGYCWRIFELNHIRYSLDNQILNPQQVNVEYDNFMRYLVSHYAEWCGQDRYRIGKCINKYMSEHFDEVLSQSVDNFLTNIFNPFNQVQLAGIIQDEILDKVREKAAPLFWNSPYFRLDRNNTYSYSVMSVPSTSTAINLAAGIKVDPFMVVRKVHRGDKITCVNVVSGIPLYAYQALYDWKSVYENSTAAGVHLHEQDVNWKEVLPDPIPYSYDETATKLDEE